jgi:hypothetical protein
VFGEQRKLEPMAADRKARWKREVGWLLSVADHIVEFVAKKQVLDNGTEMEVRRPHLHCHCHSQIDPLPLLRF